MLQRIELNQAFVIETPDEMAWVVFMLTLNIYPLFSFNSQEQRIQETRSKTTWDSYTIECRETRSISAQKTADESPMRVMCMNTETRNYNGNQTRMVSQGLLILISQKVMDMDRGATSSSRNDRIHTPTALRTDDAPGYQQHDTLQHSAQSLPPEKTKNTANT